VRRLVHTAIHRFDERLCDSVMQRLSLETRARLDALLTVEFPETQKQEETASALEEAEVEAGTAEASLEYAPPRLQSALHALKQDVGPLSLERVFEEIAKLERIHQLGLPAELFAHVSAKTLDSYRNRIAVEDLQEVRRHPDPIRYILLAAYCWRRRQEIVDTLVQLLLDIAHHLSTKAERRVEKAFVKDIKKVSGKTTLLFRLAEAAVDKPDGTVREVVFPVVSEQTLRDLVKEYKAGGSTYQQQVQKAMRGPYSKHYRRMMPVMRSGMRQQSHDWLVASGYPPQGMASVPESDTDPQPLAWAAWLENCQVHLNLALDYFGVTVEFSICLYNGYFALTLKDFCGHDMLFSLRIQRESCRLTNMSFAALVTSQRRGTPPVPAKFSTQGTPGRFCLWLQEQVRVGEQIGDLVL
jgi:hypothetical protein